MHITGRKLLACATSNRKPLYAASIEMIRIRHRFSQFIVFTILMKYTHTRFFERSDANDSASGSPTSAAHRDGGPRRRHHESREPPAPDAIGAQSSTARH